MAAKKKAERVKIETGDAPETEAAEAAAQQADAATAKDPAEPAPEDELSALKADMLAMSVERDELKDRLMRALAEAENARKRGERDRKDAETYGGTRLARDVLEVYDNLGRALEAVDDELREKAAALIEGVELTRRELLTAFAKHKIEPVTPQAGDRFDPRLHQAMFEAPVPGAQPGSIIQVMQTGFVIADRLLRPAMVGVAAAMPGQPAKEAKDETKTEKAAKDEAAKAAGD